jgi:pSer/pThr/pTyr-binding forkhead associated (FHA) protein
MPKLRIRNGPYSGREKPLSDNAVTIGRDVEAGIQVLDRSASRFHCEVFPVGGMWFVRDLESKNGTFVNGEQLSDEELLRAGDVIRIGTSELVFDTGNALAGPGEDRLSYEDDVALLSNTLEFRIDDLADIQDEGGNDQRDSDARALQMLYQVGRIISQSGDGDVASAVLTYLVDALPADHGVLFLRDRNSGKLVPASVRSTASQQPVICRSLIRRAMVEGRAVITANAQEDPAVGRRDSAVFKGIGAVMCVPLGISMSGGQPRGVLYVSRNAGKDPFAQRELEVLTGTAVPLSLAFQSQDQRRRQRDDLTKALTSLVRLLEGARDCIGSGERVARSAAALGQALDVAPAVRERLRLAGLLHHLPQLGGRAALDDALPALADLEPLDGVVALVRAVSRHEVGEGLDVELSILQVAVALDEAQRAHPEADVDQLIESLLRRDELDRDVLQALRNCHLRGTLYSA